jgi:D-threo-aldose 1-dehydrogenase
MSTIVKNIAVRSARLVEATISPSGDEMSVRNALLAGPLGYGGAPLGNMFRNIPEEEALATVSAAWDQGIRFFDTAPFYGAGLSEIRMGKVLSKHNRDDCVLSTKVGRIILDEIEAGNRQFAEKSGLFEHGRANKIMYDYSEEGATKSIHDSLQRLGVERLDFVWVHDLAQDFHGDAWLSMFETARTGAFRALTKLCEKGIIKAWGLGVNKVEPCELALDLKESRPTALLLAGRYTLLDHERALQRLMPKAAELKVDVVIGGPYSSGVLVGGDRFEYQKASPEILAKVARIKALTDRYKIPIKAAALHFSLAHPASAAIIPGASKPERIAEDIAALKVKVPGEFWYELRKQGLVASNAPLPIDR